MADNTDNNEQNEKPSILGFSASLRSSRFGAGAEKLLDELKGIESEDALYDYLENQANICLEDFVKAGRNENLPFDEIYRNLNKRKGDRGLSNSEIMLAAAMWGALDQGVDIDYLPLSQFLSASGKWKEPDTVLEKLASANGAMVSTPVYFGDRSSPSQSLLDLLKSNPMEKEKMMQKVYGGLSVGAKRNGGQETALIYQMLDFLDLGMVAVGNDSETTAQYGGTGHAGDVGKMSADKYGLGTAIGTGRRVANIARVFKTSEQWKWKAPLNISIWVLKDSEDRMSKYVEELIQSGVFGDHNVTVSNFTEGQVEACIACDICPEEVGDDDQYRCIIKSKNDIIRQKHHEFLTGDIIIVAACSPREHSKDNTNYQRFIERTRYLRRGDYLLTNRFVIPLVLEDVGSCDWMAVRILTSMIRHHTVMGRPLIAYQHGKDILNRADILSNLQSGIQAGEKVAKGHMALSIQDSVKNQYHPVGYVLSTQKDKEKEVIEKRERAVEHRFNRFKKDVERRLEKVGGE